MSNIKRGHTNGTLQSYFDHLFSINLKHESIVCVSMEMFTFKNNWQILLLKIHFVFASLICLSLFRLLKY